MDDIKKNEIASDKEEIFEQKDCKKKLNYLDEYVHDFEFTSEMEENAKKVISEDKEIFQTDTEKSKNLLEIQSRNWEKFYKHNKTNFFKDRHYIIREFSELKDDEREKIVLLDIGCGVGNSFFPLIAKKKNLLVNAFDFSSRAVEMAKVNFSSLKKNRLIHYSMRNE